LGDLAVGPAELFTEDDDLGDAGHVDPLPANGWLGEEVAASPGVLVPYDDLSGSDAGALVLDVQTVSWDAGR